jgi:hypothetical protein
MTRIGPVRGPRLAGAAQAANGSLALPRRAQREREASGSELRSCILHAAMGFCYSAKGRPSSPDDALVASPAPLLGLVAQLHSTRNELRPRTTHVKARMAAVVPSCVGRGDTSAGQGSPRPMLPAAVRWRYAAAIWRRPLPAAVLARNHRQDWRGPVHDEMTQPQRPGTASETGDDLLAVEIPKTRTVSAHTYIHHG